MKIENDWIGQMSKWVLSDSAALKLYLDVIGKCPDYSVNNQLLLMYESQEKPFTMRRERHRRSRRFRSWPTVSSIKRR